MRKTKPPPKGLSREAKAWWRKILDDCEARYEREATCLDRLGLLTAGEREQLADGD